MVLVEGVMKTFFREQSTYRKDGGLRAFHLFMRQRDHLRNQLSLSVTVHILMKQQELFVLELSPVVSSLFANALLR
jgi:hypothetical protein